MANEPKLDAYAEKKKSRYLEKKQMLFCSLFLHLSNRLYSLSAKIFELPKVYQIFLAKEVLKREKEL